MDSRRGHKFWGALVCLLAAWLLLYLSHIAAIGIFTRVPFAVPLVLLFAGGALIARARVTRRTRVGFGVAIALLAVAIAAGQMARRDTEGMHERWRYETSGKIATTLSAVGAEVARLEALSSRIGDEVTAFVRAQSYDPRADIFAAFARLDSIATRVSATGGLAPDTQIGIQLFDPEGERVAWAGWPQDIDRLDRVLLLSHSELVYSRRVSLYQILTHLIPVYDGTRYVATIVVDTPLEVNYRVNNRFLTSASLADALPAIAVADVTFEYFPVVGNLPYRLGRLAEAFETARDAHRRRVASLHGRAAPRDSVLAYYPLPDNVVVTGGIAGDEAAGLRGRVVVHAPQGNPLIGVTAVSHPYAHDAAERRERFGIGVKTCVVLTLLVLFGLWMARLREGTAERHVWARAGLFAAFMVALRYSLLAFRQVASAHGPPIFDPTVFATPVLGGIMRSAGDLLITSVFFIVTLYGLLKIIRSGDTRVAHAPSAPGAGFGWSFLPKAVGVLAIIVLAFEIVRRFVAAVVINANPRLLGEAVRLIDTEVLVLQLSVFLTVTGILLTAIIGIWGLMRITRTGARGLTRVSALALVLIVIVAAALQRWELVLISLPVLVFVVWAPRFVRREDLVSIVIAAFALVIISSGTTYTLLSRDYDGLRKSFVEEKAGEMLDPSDNWKVVILEDILDQLSTRPDVRQLVRVRAPDTQRLAFDLWAESSLSLLGYSCSIHVLDAQNDVVSEFSVDMPYRVRISEGGERIDTPDDSDWAVLDLTRSTPRGIVRFYRGILNVTEIQMLNGESEKTTVGKVIIDLPFFFENLELAARTGPRTPEVLRNIQQGTVAPRVEEPEALLLARLDGTRIYESSSEKLPLGTRIPDDVLERAREGRWPVLATEGGTYRIIAYPIDGERTSLVAGFAAASFKRHLLRWSTLFSLYLFFAFVMIVVTVALSAIPTLEPLLPTLTPGRRLGFQQKLLASFLVVALVPAIILGLFSVDFIRERFVEENRQEALDKAFTARKAFVNLLHGELQFFLDEVDIAELFNPDGPATQRVGTDRIARRFIDTADLLQYGPPDFPVAGALHETSTEDLFVVREGGAHYIGVVSSPLHVSDGGWNGVFYIYYARRLDAALLGEIADQVGGDVNLYDEGALVASSREGLLAGGFISAIMNAGAFVKVSMLGSESALATEQAGSYRYQVAYLPVTNWGDGSVFRSVLDPQQQTEPAAAPDRAAISVPLVFRPESYYVEVQKATSLILGIFALLFTATIALGLILARGIFEPLRALLAGTRRIADGDFTAHIGVRRSDEIGTVVSAFNEMTERIAASQRVLEERRRYLETILQNIGTGVISTDGDDRIRNFNRAAERILGLSARDVVGRTPAEMAALGQAGDIFALLSGEGRGGDGGRSSRRFVSDEIVLERDKAKMTVRFMLTRLEHDTRYLGTVFVFEDLTELIQSKKLSAWVEMARQIAHEIKNPLTPIRISTQFMRRAYETRPEEFEKIFREGTETIMHQVDVLKRIASEFSSYGRMQQLDVAPHPLEPILRGILTPYEKNDAGVRVHYENGIPDATVLLDPEAVRKICANLIENALEAMPDGGDLRVSCRETPANGPGLVHIKFEDTGAGLDAEVADRLFEPYFSTKTTGTGLGLAICRTLAHEMGGEVTVQNRPGQRGVEAVLTLRVERL